MFEVVMDCPLMAKDVNIRISRVADDKTLGPQILKVFTLKKRDKRKHSLQVFRADGRVSVGDRDKDEGQFPSYIQSSQFSCPPSHYETVVTCAINKALYFTSRFIFLIALFINSLLAITSSESARLLYSLLSSSGNSFHRSDKNRFLSENPISFSCSVKRK